MMRFALHVFSLTLGCASAAAHAQVIVQTPWVRATVPGQSSTGAFMDLTSAAGTTLVGVSSPSADMVGVHRMDMTPDGIMKMREVERLPLPAGKTVHLAPGGYHIMLMDLRAPLRQGEKIPLTLTIEDAQKKQQTIEVQAEVRALGVPQK